MKVLKDEIKKRGFTYVGFSKLIKMSRPHIDKISANPEQAKLKDLKKICDGLNIKVRDFLEDY